MAVNTEDMFKAPGSQEKMCSGGKGKNRGRKSLLPVVQGDKGEGREAGRRMSLQETGTSLKGKGSK